MATILGPLNPEQIHSRAQVDMMVANKMRKQLGFSRDPRPNLPELAPIYLFNVSDKAHRWHQPGFDFYEIPACPEDRDYSEPCAIPALVPMEYLKIDSTNWLLHNGEEIAAEILQVGAGKDPKNDLRRVGVFMSRSNPPQQSEIDEARRLLLETCEQLLSEADRIHAEGQRKGPDGQMIGTEHLWAARFTGQTRDWARPIRQNRDCPHCQTPVPMGANVHYGPGGCGGVINWKGAVAAGLKTMAQWNEAASMLPPDDQPPGYKPRRERGVE